MEETKVDKAVHHVLGRTGLLIIAAVVLIIVIGAVLALIYYVTNRPDIDNAGTLSSLLLL